MHEMPDNRRLRLRVRVRDGREKERGEEEEEREERKGNRVQETATLGAAAETVSAALH